MTTVARIDETEARSLLDELVEHVEMAREIARRLYQGRAWLALGYKSWDELCDAELRDRLSIGRDQRPSLVASLRAEGLSTRAIAKATGVSPGTVRNDLSTGGQFLPTSVEGQDGKQYPAARPGPSLADVNQDVELPDTPGVVDVTPCRVCGRVDLDDGEYWEDSDLCDTCAARTVTHPDLDMHDGAKQRRCGLCDTWWPGWDALDEHITDVHVTPTNNDEAEDEAWDCGAFTVAWETLLRDVEYLHEFIVGLGTMPEEPDPRMAAEVRTHLLIAQDYIRDMLRRLPEQPAQSGSAA